LIVLLVDGQFLYICNKEKSESISGVLDLTCARVHLFPKAEAQLIDPKIKEQFVFGFRITRNQKSLDAYSTSQEVYHRWRALLLQMAMFSTFHEDFIVTKMIGKGSFAKVYLGTKKEDSNKYAIKVFNKQFIGKPALSRLTPQTRRRRGRRAWSTRSR